MDLRILRNGRLPVTLAIGSVLCFIFAYSLFVAFPYLAGPTITLTVETSESGITTLSGATKRVSFLEINGAPIPLEENGAYSVLRAYPSGYTAITVLARDRFGRAITKTAQLVIP